MPTIFTRGAASARGFGLFGTVAAPAVAGGGLWSWGYNNNGQLGLGDTTARSSPVQVGALTAWATVSEGYRFSVAIKTDGTLWSWGYAGASGYLGLGNTTSYSSPKQVGALTAWATVSASRTSGGFSLAVKTDGTLWSWGRSNSGALGLGNLTAYSSPKQIGALTNWSKVSAGSTRALAVKTDGTLWAWGNNSSGQLGLGNTTNYSSPKQVGALTAWATVSAAHYHSLAVKTDGTLWSWGFNNQGQLGLGNTTTYSSPKQVGAGTTWATALASGGTSPASLAIKTDGTLWSWGSGASGKLGHGNTTNYSSPKQVGALTTWSKVASGKQFSHAIKTDGTLWAWGDGVAAVEPAGRDPGSPGKGALGLGATAVCSSPVQVGALTTWTAAAAGDYTVLAIKT